MDNEYTPTTEELRNGLSMCEAPECERPVYCRGYCTLHYQRLRRHGSLINPGRKKPSVEDVLLSSYDVTATGCWQWTRAISTQGYGLLWRGNRKYLRAHVASYELHIGPVPDGLVLDHLCRNRACINPNHLEPVPNRANVLRGEGPTAVNARKTHCVNGHEFSAENTRIRPSGWRECKVCKRRQNRASKERVRNG